MELDNSVTFWSCTLSECVKPYFLMADQDQGGIIFLQRYCAGQRQSFHFWEGFGTFVRSLFVLKGINPLKEECVTPTQDLLDPMDRGWNEG